LFVHKTRTVHAAARRQGPAGAAHGLATQDGAHVTPKKITRGFLGGRAKRAFTTLFQLGVMGRILFGHKTIRFANLGACEALLSIRRETTQAEVLVKTRASTRSRQVLLADLAAHASLWRPPFSFLALDVRRHAVFFFLTFVLFFRLFVESN